ncbi:MAG: HPr family phosphocarrier protein [Phycisphaerae bacterium]
MSQREVEIVNPLGLHMRPAAKFVETANRYRAGVTVRKGDQEVNGKSITEMMLLEALPGTTLVLESNGEDADDCLDALAEVVANFDKDEEPQGGATRTDGNP